MSTRGCVGIRFHGVDKIGYNHMDSYPSGLGSEVIDYIRNNTDNQLIEVFDTIKTTGEEGLDVWDKGEFNRTFEEYGKFMFNSQSCEWAYILDLDSMCLEIYKGKNKDKYAPGAYVGEEPGSFGYYGVSLQMTIPFKSLRRMSTELIVKVLEDIGDQL